MALPLLLVPSDPLTPLVPDPHFAREADAARQAGMDVAVVDHDAIVAGDIQAAVRRIPASDVGQTAWYRGWMLPATAYARLATALETGGIRLLTSPSAYRTVHELPGWFDVFADLTPASTWLPWEPNRIPEAADLAAPASTLGGGPAVVKDYVKSRKHEWHEACFIPDLADLPTASRVVARMIELQDDDLNGGIVIRRFESFEVDDAGRSREARAWWIRGSLALITPHPDAPAGTAIDVPTATLDAVRSGVRALGAPFVTTDLAPRSDGVWRVIEVGDGQVSDLPATQDPAPLMQALSGGPAPHAWPCQ